MRPFKYICIILSIVTLMLSAGCGQSADDTPATFFQLKEDPVITVEKTDTVYKRLTADYQGALVPADNYGPLQTFIGGYYEYKSTAEGSTATVKNPVYGLCTADGTVVVDAVYDAYKLHPTDEGSYVYELIIGADGSDPYKGERYIAALDGSWMFKIPEKSAFYSAGGDRVILERTRTSKKIKYIYHDFYDHKGKRKFTFDKTLAEDQNISYTIGAFSEGLAPVNIWIREKKDGKMVDTFKAYYIDNNGKKVQEGLTECESFKNGYAVVRNDKGLFGVLTPKGEWFLEPNYRAINYNSDMGLFASASEGYFEIFDKEKKVVKKVFTERGTVEVVTSERLIYLKVNPDTERIEYFYADTDEPFSCKETGQFPDSGNSVGGLFVCVYSGTGTIFGEDGEAVASIGDFGELVDRFGNTAVVVNENDRKVCFVSVSTKQRTEWMKHRYTRECLDGRYLVLENSSDKTYGLYDLLTNSFVFEKCDCIGLSTVNGNQLLSVVDGVNITVYNKELKAVLNAATLSRH